MDIKELYLGLTNISILADKAKKVERTIYIPHTDRLENDAEHSFDLTMFAWYLATALKLENLDVNKVIKLCLVHDLLETITGDLDYFASLAQHIKQKEYEAQALITLRSQFQDFSEMTDLIQEFEKKETRESKFVFCCDKLVPAFIEIQNSMRTTSTKNIPLITLAIKATDYLEFPELLDLYENVILPEFKSLYIAIGREDLISQETRSEKKAPNYRQEIEMFLETSLEKFDNATS